MYASKQDWELIRHVCKIDVWLPLCIIIFLISVGIWWAVLQLPPHTRSSNVSWTLRRHSYYFASAYMFLVVSVHGDVRTQAVARSRCGCQWLLNTGLRSAGMRARRRVAEPPGADAPPSSHFTLLGREFSIISLACELSLDAISRKH